MKEMLGGCCVCSDENGWNDNPLIYCDGPDCEVAVHQGCYGIQEVPEGEWFCAKCQDLPSSSFTSDTNQLNGIRRKPARCELCCFDFGALKKTETGGWAHVICALYIPEVRFGDVHTMDPVIISHVPNDRFDKPCYICVNKGDTAGAASGACMSCNKPGCKRGFHVTCAQQRGLLCEEGGGSKNVKYCGYCDHHLRKAALDPAIKIVPPCRVRAHPTLLHSQPTPPSSNNSAGHMLVDPIPRPEGTVLGHPVHSTEDSHLHSNFSPPLTTSSRSSVALDATPPLVVPSSMNTLKNESHRPPSTNGFNPHTASHAGELTNHNRIERNGHSDEKSNIVESTSTLHQIQSTPVTSSKSGKRPREPKHDGENKKRQRTNRPTKSEKVLLSLVGPVVSETVSDFQRERVADRSAAERRAAAAAAASVPSTSHDINGGGGTLQVFSPTTNDDKSGIRGSSSTTCTLGGPSGSTLPSSMEQLLERQWEQESQLMIAQAHTQFDVSKLLNCLHQLKSENIRLEEQLNHLSRRRDHLIALNTRLAIPLNASFSPSIHQHQQQLIQHHIQHHQQQQQQQGIQSSPHQSPQVATTSSTVTVPSCPPPVPSTVSTQPSTIAATEDSLTQLRSLATGNGTSRVQATPPPTSHCTTAAAVAVQTPSTSYSTATTNSYIQQQHQPTSRSSISSVTSASVPPTIQSPVASQAQTPTVAELAANISPDRLNAMNTLNLLGRQQLLGSNMELASFVLANQGFNNNLNLLARFMRHQ